MSPSSVPPQAPSSGRPLPIRRVLWGEFPDLIGTYQPTPTSRLPSRLASSPSLGTTTASPSFVPPEQGDSPWAWTTSTAAPAPPLNGGEDEISQVPGRPLRTCPALRPRRTADPRPLQDRRCSLPHFKQRRLRICPFRGSITRPARSLCTLRSRGRPRTTQHSIPAGGQP